MEHSILVVEDDEILADNIRTYLSLKGYEVIVCHSAELALEQIKRAQPDAVLTDNSLPGMSGHDLLRTLVAQAPDLKVIMMTGYGNVEDAVQAMKEGAFHYLTKPVVLAELKLTLDKALATERMERTLSFYQEREAQKSGLQALIGESPVMLTLKHTLRQVLDAERRMASDDLPPVLIEGETVLARNWWPVPCISMVRAVKGLSSSSIALRSLPTCLRPNCLATRRARSPMPRNAG